MNEQGESNATDSTRWPIHWLQVANIPPGKKRPVQLYLAICGKTRAVMTMQSHYLQSLRRWRQSADAARRRTGWVAPRSSTRVSESTVVRLRGQSQ